MGRQDTISSSGRVVHIDHLHRQRSLQKFKAVESEFCICPITKFGKLAYGWGDDKAPADDGCERRNEDSRRLNTRA